MLEFVIEGKLPSLNDYVAKCRANYYVANKFKKDQQELVLKEYLKSKKGKLDQPPYKVSINWYEKTKRRDIDNVSHGLKYILDTLVENGVLENDNQKFIRELEQKFYQDKDNPRIEVEITSIESVL